MKIKYRKIQSIQHARKCHYCFRNCFKIPDWKKDVVLSDPILDCLHHSTTSKLSAIKAPPKNKNRQKMFSAFLSSVFHTKFTISELKSKQVFHPNGNWLRLPVSESSSRISKFYVSLFHSGTPGTKTRTHLLGR